MSKEYHSGNLRSHRRMDMPGTWFVTKCLTPRKSILTTSDAAKSIIDAFAHRVETKAVPMGAFVVMPDHWHAVLAVGTLSSFMQGLDSWISRNTADILRSFDVRWQDTFFDTEIHSMRQFLYVCNYIECNPMRKGLCTVPDEWKYSSAHEDNKNCVTRPWPWDFARDHQ